MAILPNTSASQLKTLAQSDLDDWLQSRTTMMQHIQQNLARAKQGMENQADKHRQERNFAVGD